MRPGDLVELKEGLFGLKSPQNLGIFLERRKRKKDFFAVVVTLRGVKEIKPQQITARRFNANVDPSAGEESLVGRLRDLVREASTGALDEAKPGASEDLEERTCWERLVGKVDAPLRPDELAAVLIETPSKGEIRRMTDLLERCKRPGVGFFERHERGRWAPVAVDAYKTFHREMEAAGRLRKRLVVVATVEDGSGETWETLRGIPVHEAGLDEAERSFLATMGQDMARAVEMDAWADDITPRGTSVHTIEGQSYHRLLENLARDWTGATGVSRSSTLVQFLVDTGLVSVQDAIRLIARRRVRAAPNFSWETPEEVDLWARDRFREPAELAAEDRGVYAARADLRHLESYSIDPPDAKDFDDAVAIEPASDGGTTLWVHIADVSFYVEKDSRLDRYARDRATSVYLPTGVLPMLPSRLSDDLCSLRAGRDRLAMSVRIDVDALGRVVGFVPMESVIKVRENARYPQVDQRIEEGVEPFASLAGLADRMRAHRRGLDIETGELRIRFIEEAAAEAARREGLSGEVDEPKSVPHETGLSVSVKHASPATKLVEVFMVAANEAVSRFVDERNVAVPFRCHPLPEREKAGRFAAQARALGLDVAIDLPEDKADAEDADTDGKDAGPGDDEDGMSILDQLRSGKMQLGGFAASETVGSKKEAEGDAAAAPPTVTPETARPAIRGLAQLSPEEQEAWLAPFRNALDVVQKIADEKLRALAYVKVLSTLGRAFYTPRNLGHFGLGSTSYAHFTSPIRRYPDLVLHRQLRWVLRKEAGLKVDAEAPHAVEHLDMLADHCSVQAEEAERLEWGLLASCMTFESRREEWSGALEAMVSGITAGGVFLTLPGELEARLSVREIPGGPYEVDEFGSLLFRARLPGGAAHIEDEDAAALVGHDWRSMEDPHTGEIREVRLRLGDRVRVQIRERDFVDGKVSVRLAGAQD